MQVACSNKGHQDSDSCIAFVHSYSESSTMTRNCVICLDIFERQKAKYYEPSCRDGKSRFLGSSNHAGFRFPNLLGKIRQIGIFPPRVGENTSERYCSTCGANLGFRQLLGENQDRQGDSPLFSTSGEYPQSDKSIQPVAIECIQPSVSNSIRGRIKSNTGRSSRPAVSSLTKRRPQ